MNIVVGVTGSIAAYRSPDFVKELVARGHRVRVVATCSAQELVSLRVLETFSGQASIDANEQISADLLIVYAATADFLYRYAYAAGSDVLLQKCLEHKGPVLVVPAMNPAMWTNPAVQANVLTLKNRGIEFVGPIAGVVACGEEGVGHIASHEDIHRAVESFGWESLFLRGRHVLISAGPMRSSLDPVRFLQNRSSGKMGLELARACRAAGADVSVLLGPVDSAMESEFSSFPCTAYRTPSEYESGLKSLFPKCALFLSAAAVLDFEFVAAESKVPRSQLAQAHQVTFETRPVPDFVAWAAAHKRTDQIVIAFSAETGNDADVQARARRKMLEKKVNGMLANPVAPGTGPESATNVFWVLRPDSEDIVTVGPAPKAQVARQALQALSDVVSLAR